jgi:hypothetical protein
LFLRRYAISLDHVLYYSFFFLIPLLTHIHTLHTPAFCNLFTCISCLTNPTTFYDPLLSSPSFAPFDLISSPICLSRSFFIKPAA